MIRWFVCSLMLVAVVALTNAAPSPGGKKQPATKLPLGTWTRKAGDFDVKITLRAKSLTCQMVKDGDKLQVDADIGTSADGYLFGRLAKVNLPAAGDGPKKGLLFSFRYQVKDGKLVLSEMQAENAGQEARDILEGTYEMVKKEKKKK